MHQVEWMKITRRYYLINLILLLMIGMTSCQNQSIAESKGGDDKTNSSIEEAPEPEPAFREKAPRVVTIHTGPHAALMNELEFSRVQILNAVQNLTPEQWTFRESSARWSIAEITEHLVSAERLFRTLIKDYVLQGDGNEAVHSGVFGQTTR